MRLSLILFGHAEGEKSWPRGTGSERMKGRTSTVDEERRREMSQKQQKRELWPVLNQRTSDSAEKKEKSCRNDPSPRLFHLGNHNTTLRFLSS